MSFLPASLLPALRNLDIAWVAGANIAVALLVMGVKFLAYAVTGSAALYSDAIESLVNVTAATVALVAIRLSATPADAEHPFGHHKAEYLSAVLEGALITVAAFFILREAWEALVLGRSLTEPALGLALNAAAAALNGGWAWLLIVIGRARRSPALTADGWHILTDVLTSAGVFAGLLLAMGTGAWVLDPLLAGAVAVYILWTGAGIVRQSVGGLMDEAASPEIEDRIRDAIAANGGGALQAHDIRTRTAAHMTFVEFHLVVPGTMTVEAAHTICDRLETAIARDIAGAEVVIHVEPESKAKAHGAVDLRNRAVAILD